MPIDRAISLVSTTYSAVSLVVAGLIATVFQSIDWAAVAKTWGFIGVFSVVALVLLVAGAKWMKGLLTDTISDARKERDRMAAQIDRQAQQFLESLKYRDEKFRDVADAVERIGRK